MKKVSSRQSKVPSSSGVRLLSEAKSENQEEKLSLERVVSTVKDRRKSPKKDEDDELFAI